MRAPFAKNLLFQAHPSDSMLIQKINTYSKLEINSVINAVPDVFKDKDKDTRPTSSVEGLEQIWI